MTNLDEIEINQSLNKTRIDMGEREKQYADVEWVALDDKNSLNYTKPVEFDTTPVKDRLPIYRESYVVLPLRATSSVGGTPYTSSTRLAWKCSVLSLIRSILVQPIGSGPALVNEQDGQLPLINNLRLLTAADVDWVDSTGQELSFTGCDRQVDADVMGAELHVSDGASSSTSVATGFSTNGLFSNPRLAARVAIFSNMSDRTVAANIDMIVSIPLKYIHSLFDQMGHVMPNYPMRIKFGISSFTSGSEDFMPLTTPSRSVCGGFDAAGAPLVSAAIVVAPAPVLKVETGASFRGYTPGACRLYVKTVILKPEDSTKLDSELSSGYKKTITYLTTDIYRKVGQTTSSAGVGCRHVFAENTKRPVRLWALFPPTGAISSPLSTFPATIGRAGIKDVSIRINGSILRKEKYESQLELYNELREYQLGAGYSTQQGGRISYNDFCQGVNPYLFDLSRHPSVINNMPVTLTFDSTIFEASAGVVDATFLVERWQTAVFNITKSKAETDVEDGLLP